jgi:branched-chain amino acid aminotransferase
MKEVGKIWMNGKLVPFKDAKVHVLTHALHYSTSIFEGIRCYNTPNGSAIFRLPEHVDRFFKSAKLYSMKMQFSKKVISDAIVKTVNPNYKQGRCFNFMLGVEDGRIKGRKVFRS